MKCESIICFWAFFFNFAWSCDFDPMRSFLMRSRTVVLYCHPTVALLSSRLMVGHTVSMLLACSCLRSRTFSLPCHLTIAPLSWKSTLFLRSFCTCSYFMRFFILHSCFSYAPSVPARIFALLCIALHF